MMRGFTLLELMISAAIASIVSFGVFTLMRGQIDGYNRLERVSNAHMLARSAANEVIKEVQYAGFGIPGDWSLGPTGALTDNATTPGTFNTCTGTDILEVRYRDPKGYWQLKSGSTTSLLQFGRADNVACQESEWKRGLRLFVYASVGHYSQVRLAANRGQFNTCPANLAGSTESIALTASESGDIALSGNATAATTSEVYRMVTSRFRVVCTDSEHPTLTVEHDYDTNGDGVVNKDDADPIASDIEDFQVAYLVDQDLDGNVTEADAFNLPTAAPTTTQLTSELDKLRAVKAIRINVVARAKAATVALGSAPLTVENHASSGTVDRYVRRLLRHVIVLENRDTLEPKTYLHVSNRAL